MSIDTRTDTRTDTDNNVIPFPTERAQRGFWSRLRSAPDDLDRARAGLADYYAESTYPYPSRPELPDEQPPMVPQPVPLYATVDHGFRQVWHRVVGWQWDADEGRRVPVLAVVDETVRSTPAAFAFRALNGLHYHDSMA